MNKSIDLSNVTLHTQRLTLRPWTIDDLNDFFEYASVEGVGEAAGWPHHKDINESKKILDMFIAEKKTFCIEYNGKAIGSLGVEEYNQSHYPELDSLQGRELGYVLNKDYWGKGLMTEACKKVIEYLFTELNLDFITCCYFIENDKSGSVQKKCGFKFVRIVDFEDRMGVIHKSNGQLLTKEDWLKIK